MNINQRISELKSIPNFKEKVGMILVHNGLVRGSSITNKAKVISLIVKTNYTLIDTLVREYSKKKGIFKIIVEAKQGKFYPGDDLLLIIVAGDIRTNVKPVLIDLLEAIKSKCFKKKEIFV